MKYVNLRNLGFLIDARIPIPLIDWEKTHHSSPLQVGDIVYRLSSGIIAIITKVNDYKGGFEYTCLDCKERIFKAKLSKLKDFEGNLLKEEIELLKKRSVIKRDLLKLDPTYIAEVPKNVVPFRA